MQATARPTYSPPVPLLDVNRNNAALRSDILAALTRVVDSGRFLHGPEVKELEKQIAHLAGTDHAISCASGSDALLLALMALGIGPGDEVIVPSFTFFATASAVWRVGARPVFVDIEPTHFLIDPRRVSQAVTPRTKAIIPVHLFGQCADMEAINSIARHHELYVIEDVAQAIGAKFNNHPAGSMGHVGCFSFYPTKNLGGFGDGGMLTTRDARLAERLRLFANHGMNPRYYHQVVGINSRLDTLQAAVLLVKLQRLEEWTIARRQNARRYRDLLLAANLGSTCLLPSETEGCDHVWNQFTVRFTGVRRDEIRQELASVGVGSETYYPVPLHLQECFQSLGWRPGSLPETERAAAEVLSLPIFPELTPIELETVVAQVTRACVYGNRAAA